MKTIFLVLPRRISVRYTLSAGFLGLFKNSQNIRIVILTSIVDPKFTREFSSERVVIEHIPMRDGKEFWLEKFFRQTRNYLGGIGQNIETFQAKAKMRGKVFWLGYRFLAFIFRPLMFLKHFLKFVDEVCFSYFLDSSYEVLYEKYHPDLVYIHSVQELTAVPVVRVAKRRKIFTLGTVFSWDNITNKGEIYSKTTQLTVWNEIMKQQACKYHGYKPENVFVVGTAQFDFYLKLKERFLSKADYFKAKNLDENKKLIVYTTTPERIGGEEEMQIINAIWEAINSSRILQAQLLVRVYAKDSVDRYARFVGKQSLVLDNPKNIISDPNLTYLEQDEAFIIDLASTIKNANVVVNLASTTTLDSGILNTPVINWALGNKRFWYETSHYRNLVKTKGASMAYSKEEVVAKIQEFLQSPEKLAEQRKEMVETICGPIDGKSLEKIVEVIVKILTK